MLEAGCAQRLAADAANDVGELVTKLLGVGSHLALVGVAHAEEVSANTQL